jgi:hypothetical protein
VLRAEALLRRADAWVFAPEEARRLAAVRIGLCGLLALRLALTDYDTVAHEPGLFQPHFYMRLFEGMPSAGVAASLQLCGVVAALTAAAGIALRSSLSVAVGCSLVLNGMLNSAGRVIVGDAVLTLCLLILLAAGSAAGEAWSLRDPVRRTLRAPGLAVGPQTRSARYGWPIRTAMIVIALAYFFAGLQKWRHSGVSWVTGDNLRWILYASSDSHAHPNELALFVAGRPALVHLMAAGSLMLETFFPLVLFVPKLRWLFVPGAVAMHLGIRLAMGLDYSGLALTVVIMFVDWPVVVGWVRRSATSLPAARTAPG